MDLKAVREEAIQATTRFFWEKSGFVPDQDEPKNLAMLRFRGASVLGRPYAQAADEIGIQVANRERRHCKGLCCQTLQ